MVRNFSPQPPQRRDVALPAGDAIISARLSAQLINNLRSASEEQDRIFTGRQTVTHAHDGGVNFSWNLTCADLGADAETSSRDTERKDEAESVGGPQRMVLRERSGGVVRKNMPKIEKKTLKKLTGQEKERQIKEAMKKKLEDQKKRKQNEKKRRRDEKKKKKDEKKKKDDDKKKKREDEKKKKEDSKKKKEDKKKKKDDEKKRNEVERKRKQEDEKEIRQEAKEKGKHEMLSGQRAAEEEIIRKEKKKEVDKNIIKKLGEKMEKSEEKKLKEYEEGKTKQVNNDEEVKEILKKVVNNITEKKENQEKISGKTEKRKGRDDDETKGENEGRKRKIDDSASQPSKRQKLTDQPGSSKFVVLGIKPDKDDEQPKHVQQPTAKQQRMEAEERPGMIDRVREGARAAICYPVASVLCAADCCLDRACYSFCRAWALGDRRK